MCGTPPMTIKPQPYRVAPPRSCTNPTSVHALATAREAIRRFGHTLAKRAKTPAAIRRTPAGPPRETPEVADHVRLVEVSGFERRRQPVGGRFGAQRIEQRTEADDRCERLRRHPDRIVEAPLELALAERRPLAEASIAILPFDRNRMSAQWATASSTRGAPDDPRAADERRARSARCATGRPRTRRSRRRAGRATARPAHRCRHTYRSGRSSETGTAGARPMA